MAIYNTLINKAAIFKLYFNKSPFNLNLDNNRGKGSSTYNTTFK